MSVDCLHRRRAANESFVDMLNSATVDIDTAPLGDDYDETALDYEMRPGDDTDEECEEEAAEECEEEAAEEITQEEAVNMLTNVAAKAKKVSIRTANYNELEDTALIKA